jgi:hypothetical protein
MPLLMPSEVRARVPNTLSDSALYDVIAEEEAELVRHFGAHGDGTTAVIETVTAYGGMLFLGRPFVSVSSVAEYSDLGGTATTLTTASYLTWPSGGYLTRLPSGSDWGARVVVTYVPVDDRARRRQVLIELVRIAVNQTAFKEESAQGVEDSYRYIAPDWQQARAQQYARLTVRSP